MSKPDIEALDDADGYPYSSHISIDGTELQLGDLLLVFEGSESNMVNFFERVYGFTWSGIITHLIDGPLPAEYREYESFADALERGKIVVAPKREQASFFIDDKTVRTLSLHRYIHQDGHQPILVDERRDPLENTPTDQDVFLCASPREVIEELFEDQPLSDQNEAEHVRNFLLDAGYDENVLPPLESLK